MARHSPRVAKVVSCGLSAARRWRARRVLSLFALVVSSGAPVELTAQTVRPTLAQLAHRVWTARDGAPGGVWALAQTRDGFLWLGGATGLFRFDGVRFEQYVPPAGEVLPSTGITTLCAAPDGALWVGYRIGGASVISEHRGLTSYGARDGLPGGVVSSFAVDSSGTVWAATARGLAYLQGARWRVVDTTRGFAGGYTNQVLVDRRGTLWVDAAGGVYALERGAQRFALRAPALAVNPEDVGSGDVREAPNGEIWTISTVRGLRRLTDSIGQRVTSSSYSVRDRGVLRGWVGLFIDRQAYAYGEYAEGRLTRFALTDIDRASRRGRVPLDTLAFSPKAGTSGRTVTAVREDQEGNIWVATEGGLDQFRTPKFLAIEWPSAFESPTLAAAEDGAVWAAGGSGNLVRLGVRESPRAVRPTLITTALRDLRGDVWVGGTSGVWYNRDGRFVSISLPPDLRQCAISAIAHARDGALWISGHRRGVFRRRSGVWERYGAPGDYATVLLSDSAGRTWIGYADGRLIREDLHSTQTYRAADGLDIGSILSAAVQGQRLFVGGDQGVAVLDGSASSVRAGEPRALFTRLFTADDELRSVSGIVTTDNALWIRDAGHVTRVPAEDVSRALIEPGYRMRAERFDARDRVDGPAYYVGPTAALTTDGHLWVSWIGGLGWIDPAHIPRNTVPPPVMVRTLAAGGRTYANSDRVTLPKRTSAMSVAYTALSLAVPERVKFRYRLVGLDTTWQDAGPRREAFYTNLRPGTYRFEVTAANDDGVWSVAPATLDVVIPPAFVQTNAFLALCAVAAGSSLWLFAVSRQRRAVASERERQQVALAERMRVARELHDTLLTDVAGLRMQLDAAARAAGPAGVATDIVARLRDQAGEALVSARKAVVDMRAKSDVSTLIAERLADAAHRAFDETNVEVRVAHTGTPRRYDLDVESEVLRIAGEALTNARAHAGCSIVVVTCGYGPRELRVEVRDNGRGFDPSLSAADGHFGLVGMRERAGAIGARLTVRSSPGQGTVILLIIPSTFAG